MFNWQRMHKDEQGQAALETAIILIAFVVIASVFAFTILSAGTNSTERGEEAIYAGLEGVQSTLATRGAVIAEDRSASGNVEFVTFTVRLSSGGAPVDLTDSSGSNIVVISYRDAAQIVPEATWATTFIGTNDGDMMLDENELAQIEVDLTGLTTPLTANTEFTLEVQPQTGAVLNLTNTTPAAIEPVMELF